MFGREKKEVFEEWRDAFLEQKLEVFWQTREEFHSYIYGTPFELATDRKPIEVVYGPKSFEFLPRTLKIYIFST